MKIHIIIILNLISLSTIFAYSPVYKRADEPVSSGTSLPLPSPSENIATASNTMNNIIPSSSPNTNINNSNNNGTQNGINNPSSSMIIIGNNNNNSTNQTNVASNNNNNQDMNPFQGKPTSASFPNNNIPPAYLTWKKPIPNQTFPPLYKIGLSNITFEWTVDPNQLKVQPMNLTLALANPQKQTITATVLDGTATEAFWDLAKIDQRTPLMVGYYTVLLYDQRGPKAIPSPGWLMADSRLVIGLYSTEAYVGRTDSMFCPTCYIGSGGPILSSMIPLFTAFSIALATSIFILYSVT
ncbi:unnamed protein product [Cunninghamella blakesleeana]